MRDIPLGTAGHFLYWFGLCFLFCFLLPIAMYHGRTFRSRYGALFGAQSSLFVGFLLGCGLLVRTDSYTTSSPA